MLLCNKNRKIPYQVTPPKEMWRIYLIEELLDIRDVLSTIDNWSMDELLITLDYLCTTNSYTIVIFTKSFIGLKYMSIIIRIASSPGFRVDTKSW